MVSTVQPGTTLNGGKYRVARLIAAGGMGEVYEAEHTRMNKRVAIKWIRPGLSTKARATERLLQEARAASRIHHPNVVDIYDVEREGDAVYLVMELLEGETLSDLLQRGQLPMHRLIALLLPAMRGVAAAHRHGVVHRDIKPDNIFLAHVEDSLDPLPKVLDFGVSKLAPRGAEQIALTRSGGTVGTPLYMAYEQLCGSREIDGRADVYAFGVILYEALTGHLPHVADSYPELIVKVTTSTLVPAKQHNPEIPGPLDRIVSWALAREPEQRLSSMDALIQELQPFATETGFRADMETLEIPSTPAPAPKAPRSDDGLGHDSTVFASRLRGSKHISSVRPPLRARGVLLAAGTLLGLLVVLALVLSRRSIEAPANVARAPLAMPSIEPPPAPEPRVAAVVEAATVNVEPASAPDAAAPLAAPARLPARKRIKSQRPPPVAAPPVENPPSAGPATGPRLRVELPKATDFY